MAWTCPVCERELVKENQWHNCVKVSVDNLFTGAEAELILVFDKILAEVAEWPSVLVSTTQNCIVFVHRQTFLIIRPMKKVLDLKFYSGDLMHGGLITKSDHYSGKYENHVRISKAEQLTTTLFTYIQASYKML